MFSSDRNELRKVFFEAWRKHQQHMFLEPLEAQLIDIALAHPEYHDILSNPEKFQNEDFVENNPFLHLSLHIAIREQINTDRPVGIKNIYFQLCKKLSDAHTAEHQMLECLGNILWQAQQNGKMPEEEEYLEMLRGL